jgi:hypothetical protein
LIHLAHKIRRGSFRVINLIIDGTRKPRRPNSSPKAGPAILIVPAKVKKIASKERVKSGGSAGK